MLTPDLGDHRSYIKRWDILIDFIIMNYFLAIISAPSCPWELWGPFLSEIAQMKALLKPLFILFTFYFSISTRHKNIGPSKAESNQHYHLNIKVNRSVKYIWQLVGLALVLLLRLCRFCPLDLVDQRPRYTLLYWLH